PQLLELASFSLESNGYKVLTAGNGVEALSIIQKNDQKIHVLITDVIMPQMDGQELAERARILNKEMKIIFQSGYNENTLVQHGIQSGEVAFLEKPYNMKTLLSKVRSVLD